MLYILYILYMIIYWFKNTEPLRYPYIKSIINDNSCNLFQAPTERYDL